MKLSHEFVPVESNVNHSHLFTFKNSSKLFRILSDGLYSDKLGSIIREISSNCYDSHVAAGKKNIPFEITIPTGDVKNNIFISSSGGANLCKFKDFGVGMSEEDIYKIYTCYGESTKTDSDEYIGAFGLGSKTPFAYVDTFNITSCYNGIKYVFTAYINEEGIPSLTKMHESCTSEINGVEISFELKKEDINNFRMKVKSYLKYFNPLPIITNNPNFFYGLDENTPIFKTEDFTFCGFKQTFGVSRLTILINNIPYSINTNEFMSSNINKHLLNNVVGILNFNIGELEVSVSREDLSYTPKTINAIIAKLKKLENEIFNYYNSLYEKNKNNLWNFFLEYYQPINEFYYNQNNDDKNKTLSILNCADFILDKDDIFNDSLWKVYSNSKGFGYKKSRNVTLSFPYEPKYKIEAKSSTKFIFIPEDKKITVGEIKKICSINYSKNRNNLIIFRITSKNNKLVDKKLKELSQKLGNVKICNFFEIFDEIISSNQIKKEEIKKNKENKQLNLFTLVNETDWKTISLTDFSKNKFDDKSYIFLLYKDDFLFNNGVVNQTVYYKDFLNLFKKFLPEDVKIYGIRKTELKNKDIKDFFEKNNGYKKCEKLIKKYYEENRNRLEIQKYFQQNKLSWSTIYDYHVSHEQMLFDKHIDNSCINEYKDKHNFFNILLNLKNIHNIISQNETYSFDKFCKFCNYNKIDIKISNINIEDIKKEYGIFRKYINKIEILKYISHSWKYDSYEFTKCTCDVILKILKQSEV